jgi:hypothetical protein
MASYFAVGDPVLTFQPRAVARGEFEIASARMADGADALTAKNPRLVARRFSLQLWGRRSYVLCRTSEARLSLIL